MHKTEAGERRKGLKRTALELEKEVKVLQNIQQMRLAARTRQNEADRLKAEAEALKDKARLETSMYGRWRRKNAPRRAPRPIPTGWLPGGRVTRCETSISAASECSMLRQPGRRPKR